MPSLAFDFDNAKSGRINKDMSVYTATIGWAECETGQNNDPFHTSRAFFSFDTSSIDDTAVITLVSFTVRRRADPFGEPDTYVLRFSIGTFIGEALDGNSQEWGAGYEVADLDVKPADKQTVIFSSQAHTRVNPIGDTDVKLWDDSSQGGGDPTWATCFNKDSAFRCHLNVTWVVPQLGVVTATGSGSVLAVGTVIAAGSATLTGVGSTSATAVQVLPGSATITGVGTVLATGHVFLEVVGSATLSGIGTVVAVAAVTAVGSATATGVGTVLAVGVVTAVASATVTGSGTVVALGTVIALLLDPLAYHRATRSVPAVDSRTQRATPVDARQCDFDQTDHRTQTVAPVHAAQRDFSQTDSKTRGPRRSDDA